ncbi:redox-regulated ATPase YchF [Desulfolucanica intricata]|uniref:redox-regulated ATPase YchF n=1 Tax=Desulfolucanica intricata TaxID=1285191 RepID=UPI00082C7A23|nr:redox-regulated ATPase YchF [Desulfolucanica intricata]
MALTTALIGLPLVGKTTIFNILTDSEIETSDFLSGKTETHVGMAKIPDKRVRFLSELYKPKKTTYAEIQFSDVPGLVRGSSQGKGVGNQFLNAIRNVDLLVHVVRVFENSNVTHVDDSINPMRDIETINMELLLADMDIVEKRINRIRGGKKVKKEDALELEILQKLLEGLENEVPIHNLGLTDEEKNKLRNYSFLTEKPMIMVLNLDEEQYKSQTYSQKSELQAFAAEKNLPLIEICGKIEMEINQLSDEDKDIFLEDLGITESGIDRLAKAAYDYLNLMSFFTSGEDEVKAWTIEKGTNAKKAAGKIHSDIERGFIRAEVVKYEDMERLGSMVKIRENGLQRLEGKEYIVEDGDIINFRFNV